jgi:hypothetical protein
VQEQGQVQGERLAVGGGAVVNASEVAVR